MNTMLNLIILGVSLSMDTFSVSLSIGSFNVPLIKRIILSLMVAIMHFFMPILGNLIGIKIIFYLNIDVSILLSIILLIIDIDLIIDLVKKEDRSFNLNTLSLFMISLSVSLDSFSTGIGLSAITDNIVLASTIFSIISFIFTYIGLELGNYSNKHLGNISKIIGVILLFLVAIYHLFV